jgi:hypothetical protein
VTDLDPISRFAKFRTDSKGEQRIHTMHPDGIDHQQVHG